MDATFKDGVLTAVRHFNHSCDDVFEAWVETAKTQQWWGCGETCKVHSEIDPRVGGRYYHLMTIGDHGDYPVNGLLTEYEPPNKLSYEIKDEQTQ